MHGMDADEQLLRVPRMAGEQLVHAVPHHVFGKVMRSRDSHWLDPMALICSFSWGTNNSSSTPLEKAWELGVLVLGDEGNWKEAGNR